MEQDIFHLCDHSMKGLDNREMLFKKVDKPKKKTAKAVDMEVNHKKEVDNEEKSS